MRRVVKRADKTEEERIHNEIISDQLGIIPKAYRKDFRKGEEDRKILDEMQNIPL